jgi:WD40 repeat protein
MRQPVAIAGLMLVATTLGGATRDDSPGERVLVATAQLEHMAFCPDGRSLIAAGRKSGGWVIAWPSGEARHVESQPGAAVRPPCAAQAVGFSPDGRLWAVAGNDGVVRFEDARGTVIQTIDAHLGGVSSTVFSPDGTRLASSGYDNDMRIWDAKTGALLREITQMTHAAFALAWAPDSRTVYAAGASRTVTAWDTASGALLRTSPHQPYAITALGISPDGRLIVAGGVDPTGFGRPAAVRLLDASTLAERETIPTPGGAEAVAFSPDGRFLLVVSNGEPGIRVRALK